MEKPILRIVSHSAQPFADRVEGGRLLARELWEWREKKPVVLGIPRGGVVVARELARALEADLDVVLARKLRTPGYPELAMGSVAEDGRMLLNEAVVREVGVGQDYIQEERGRQLSEIKRRSELIRSLAPKVSLDGRVVIVTDDGVATGATTLAAFWAAEHERPKTLIGAFPVGSEETIKMLAEHVDEIVCLRTPPMFQAVGQFYLRFEPVSDADVLEILKAERGRKAGGKETGLPKLRDGHG
jgi:putative phosphoribosyl transferase